MSLRSLGVRCKDKEVFCGPLRQMAAAARGAGYPLGKDTLSRLFMKKKKTMKHTLKRGVINAKRGAVVMCRAAWGARCCYSANRVKNAKTFLHDAASRGIATVAQWHVDEMAKQPIWHARRARRKLGYMLVAPDGRAVVENWDHTFPLAPSFLISLHGVVKCARPPCPKRIHEKGLVPTFRPSRTFAFIRSHRYHPGGSHTLQRDFLCAARQDPESQAAEIGLVVCDNGGGYSLDVPFNVFSFGRYFRKTDKALFIVCANGAGDSKFNWEVESGWSLPRNKLNGVELGKDAVADIHKPLEEFATAEKGLQHISDAAMRQMAGILRGCHTAGEPWQVDAPVGMEEYDDHALVRALYEASSKELGDAKEFAKANGCSVDVAEHLFTERRDIEKHLEKSHSFIQYKQCEDPSCRPCMEAKQRRRLVDPEWTLAKPLRQLMWNGGWFPFSEIKDPAVAALAREAVTDPAVERAGELVAMPLPTTTASPWAKPGPAVFKPWSELVAACARQREVLIPVRSEKSRDGVLQCATNGCRWVSKTPAEFERHARFCKPPPAVAAAAVPTQGSMDLGEYSVAGVPPVVRKRRADALDDGDGGGEEELHTDEGHQPVGLDQPGEESALAHIAPEPAAPPAGLCAGAGEHAAADLPPDAEGAPVADPLPTTRWVRTLGRIHFCGAHANPDVSHCRLASGGAFASIKERGEDLYEAAMAAREHTVQLCDRCWAYLGIDIQESLIEMM